METMIKTESYIVPASSDIETKGPGWNLDWNRALLLVHDMQRYFVRTIPEAVRTPLLDNTATLVKMARRHGSTIAYTAQPGRMTTEQRGLLRDFWGEGMTSTEEDRQIIDEIHPQSDDVHFTKWRYSAYARTNLARELVSRKLDQIVVCGVYTHVGILSTAIDSLAYDIQCFVVGNATADFSSEYQINALTYIAKHCGQVLFMGDDLI